MTQKTVRVRIAVAVNSAGEWATTGYAISHTTNPPKALADAAAGENAQDYLGPGVSAVHFIEADIPLPTSVTVKGEVVT